MKRPWTYGLALVGLILVCGAGQVRADFVTFDSQWSIAPGAVLTSGTGSVSFALAGSTTTTAETGVTTAIIAATITTTSSATQPPDTFSASFNLGLDLTSSGQTGHLDFTGTITGQLTATSSTLTNTFNSNGPQVLKLGDYLFSVTINPVVANLPKPGAEAPVLVDAMITITKDSGGSPPIDTPEPSSLVLGATALSLTWLARRRRVWTRRVG